MESDPHLPNRQLRTPRLSEDEVLGMLRQRVRGFLLRNISSVLEGGTRSALLLLVQRGAALSWRRSSGQSAAICAMGCRNYESMERRAVPSTTSMPLKSDHVFAPLFRGVQL